MITKNNETVLPIGLVSKDVVIFELKFFVSAANGDDRAAHCGTHKHQKRF